MKVVGECRGFNRLDHTRREMLQNKASLGPESEPSWTRRKRGPRGFAAPKKRLEPDQFRLPSGCRSAAIWHFNCLAGKGRWWPGTLVV